MKNKKMFLCIALILTAMVLSMCSKKAEAQESKGGSAAGSAKTEAYNSESDFQIDWDKNVKDGVIITKYIGTKNEVNIPPSIQNSPVTGIEEWSFSENKNITKVTIPNGVTSIGEFAFKSCTSLTSITIPNSVISIGGSAFQSCTSLTSITIPNSVISIGKAIFNDCTSLISVTLPNNITSISDGAFQGCSSLTNITIPDSVTSIGEWAFNNCYNLTSIIIPNSVTSIIAKTFANCTNLTSVTFQSTITSGNFSSNMSFPGDLRTKYLASDGGPGTYKRFANGEVWKKQ